MDEHSAGSNGLCQDEPCEFLDRGPSSHVANVEKKPRKRIEMKRSEELQRLHEVLREKREQLQQVVRQGRQLERKRGVMAMLLSWQQQQLQALQQATRVCPLSVERPLPSPVPFGQSYYTGTTEVVFTVEDYSKTTLGDLRATLVATVRGVMPLLAKDCSPQDSRTLNTIVDNATHRWDELFLYNPGVCLSLSSLNLDSGCIEPPPPGLNEQLANRLYPLLSKEALAQTLEGYLKHRALLVQLGRRRHEVLVKLQELDKEDKKEALPLVLERQVLVERMQKIIRRELLIQVMMDAFYRRVSPRWLQAKFFVEGYPYLVNNTQVAMCCVERYLLESSQNMQQQAEELDEGPLVQCCEMTTHRGYPHCQKGKWSVGGHP